MTFGPESTQTKVEQMLAFGRSDHYITTHLGVTRAEIDRVRLHLETVAYEKDDPRPDSTVRRCLQGHPLTGDNLTNRTDGRLECLRCKKDRDRQRNKRKAARAA